MMITTVAQSLGHDLRFLKISHSTLWRARNEGRKRIAERIKNHFEAKYATVHWEGKLMASIIKKEKVERLPIIVSQESGVQILGVPYLRSASRALMAEAIYDTLREWNAVKNIECASFDTTAPNNGYLNGAIVLLERLLKKRLLKLACRHHVYELILRQFLS